MGAPRSVEEAVASIREAAREISMPVERLTNPSLDPSSNRHGPGVQHPNATPTTPAPFLARAVQLRQLQRERQRQVLQQRQLEQQRQQQQRQLQQQRQEQQQAALENSYLVTNTPSGGNAAAEGCPLTPPGLTSNASSSSPEVHDNVPPTPHHGPTLPSVTNTNTKAEKPLKIIPKPARPEPDVAKCFRHPPHDPMMGASCPYGFGERSRPFPFLDSRRPAEKPPNWLLNGISESWKRGDAAHDIKKLVRSISAQTGHNGQGSSRQQKDASSSAGSVPGYVKCDDIPSTAALAHADNVDEARELNPNVGPFGYGFNNHIFRIASIHNKIERSDVKHLPMWQLDLQTGEPGPQLDLQPLFSMVATGEEMPRQFKELMYDLHQHIYRYMYCWDMLLRELHTNFDVGAQFQQIRREVYELQNNQTHDRAKKEKIHMWRRYQNNEESHERIQQYKARQAELISATKALYELKMKAAALLADPQAACQNWRIERQKEAAIARAGQQSSGPHIGASNNIAGAKRARENDGQVQASDGTKRMRLSK